MNFSNSEWLSVIAIVIGVLSLIFMVIFGVLQLRKPKDDGISLTQGAFSKGSQKVVIKKNSTDD